MYQSLIISFCLFGLLSCANSDTTITERAGEPSIYTVSSLDEEMNEAIIKARNSLSVFNKALKASRPEYGYFALKIAYKTPTGNEHIWVRDVFLENNTYYGVIDNLPESLVNVAPGDTIKINNNNISDWMYTENMKLRGGHTTRLLRGRMSNSERKKFDEETGLIFEE